MYPNEAELKARKETLMKQIDLLTKEKDKLDKIIQKLRLELKVIDDLEILHKMR